MRMNEAFLHVSVRLLVGLICAAIGAFFGALVIAMIVASAETSDAVSGVARLAFVAATAATGSRVGWFGTSETLRQSLTLWVASVAASIIGSWIALAIGGMFFDHTDLYVLNRDISGAGFFGAVFASNVPSLIFASRLARRREI